MKKYKHNFYFSGDVLYLHQNKKHWLVHYEMGNSGIYSNVDYKILAYVHDNNVWLNTSEKILNKITGKTYDWFI